MPVFFSLLSFFSFSLEHSFLCDSSHKPLPSKFTHFFSFQVFDSSKKIKFNDNLFTSRFRRKRKFFFFLQLFFLLYFLFIASFLHYPKQTCTHLLLSLVEAFKTKEKERLGIKSCQKPPFHQNPILSFSLNLSLFFSIFFFFFFAALFFVYRS